VGKVVNIRPEERARPGFADGSARLRVVRRRRFAGVGEELVSGVTGWLRERVVGEVDGVRSCRRGPEGHQQVVRQQ
jgi:hypothetical protein